MVVDKTNYYRPSMVIKNNTAVFIFLQFNFNRIKVLTQSKANKLNKVILLFTLEYDLF